MGFANYLYARNSGAIVKMQKAPLDCHPGTPYCDADIC